MPNQINPVSFVNPTNQAQEKIQTWIDSMANDKSYCFYISVGRVKNGITHSLGNWNIPFYSFEEANQFKNAMQLEHPDCRFYFITGVLHTEKTTEDVSCIFWEKWQQKHHERISLLNNKG